MQTFLTHSNPDRGETISMIHDWTKLMAVASNHVFWHVETIFTSGLLIFVLAPDISTIILAFLRGKYNTNVPLASKLTEKEKVSEHS